MMKAGTGRHQGVAGCGKSILAKPDRPGPEVAKADAAKPDTSMKAILCTRLGGPDDLELVDLPNPRPGPDEAVVRIEAAALNFFDTLIIAGKYQVKPTLPFSPAAEFAGTVEAVGAGVTSLARGDRVLGHANYGAARERLAISVSKLVKLPSGLDFDRAAGLTITYGTSYYALKERAALRTCESLVALVASGDVGLAAVQLG